MEEKKLTEQESIELISNMIGKARADFNESGASAILWGAVTAVCGLLSYAERQFAFNLPFDPWLLILVAIIPQVFISIRESRGRVVKTHSQFATDQVFKVFAFSLIGLVLYSNIVPQAHASLLAADQIEVFSRNLATGAEKEYRGFTVSLSSIYLLVYAMPTLATGLITKYRPMIIGSVICYAFFLLSLFTPFIYDALLLGLAGITNWLIPGLMLQRDYRKAKARHV